MSGMISEARPIQLDDVTCRPSALDNTLPLKYKTTRHKEFCFQKEKERKARTTETPFILALSTSRARHRLSFFLIISYYELWRKNRIVNLCCQREKNGDARTTTFSVGVMQCPVFTLVTSLVRTSVLFLYHAVATAASKFNVKTRRSIQRWWPPL